MEVRCSVCPHSEDSHGGDNKFTVWCTKLEVNRVRNCIRKCDMFPVVVERKIPTRRRR